MAAEAEEKSADEKTGEEENNAPSLEHTLEELEKFKAKKDLEATHRRNAEKERDKLKARLDEIEASQAKQAEEAAREKAKTGDVEALEKSYQSKIAKLEEERNAIEERYKGMVSGLTSEKEAASLASEIFGEKADVFLPHIAPRLKTEFTEEGPRVRVLDENGQPTGDNLDELRDYFKTSPKFAPFTVQSRASGSGASGSSKGSGATTKTMKSADFYQLPESERKAYIKEGGKLNSTD